MTIPKTPRLTELEANAHELPPHWTGHNVHGLVAGYKQAQADYQPEFEMADAVDVAAETLIDVLTRGLNPPVAIAALKWAIQCHRDTLKALNLVK